MYVGHSQFDDSRLASTELLVSEDVIDKAGKCRGGLGAYHSDAAYQRTVHRTLHKTEDVLYEAS